MRCRTYQVLERAVEEGIGYGWRRAHKYTDKPDETTIRSEIENAVMTAICEYFDFDEAEPMNAVERGNE